MNTKDDREKHVFYAHAEAVTVEPDLKSLPVF